MLYEIKLVLVIIATSFFIGVNGQTTSIPDANFEQALINLGLDSGVPDGIVLTTNINTVSVLDVSSSSISDLTGIEDFTSLTYLICVGNQLASLDVTQNTALTYLNCNDNQLTSLDVTQNVALQSLLCIGNQLASLDVSQNTSLTDLNCGANQLTSLDVSQNVVLTLRSCSNNQLTCLNVRNGFNLNLGFIGASGNPNLSCIEVDDAGWSTANWTNIDVGTSFSTNCNNDCSPVGIDERGFASEFSLYSNPVFNNLTIEFEQKEQFIRLSVVNIHGQQVLSNEYGNVKNISLNIADLSSGIYFVKIINNEGNQTVKFIKE